MKRASSPPHEKERRIDKKFRWCEDCSLNVPADRFVAHLRKQGHQQLVLETISDDIQLLRSAFKSRIATYKILNMEDSFITPNQFFENKRTSVVNLWLAQLTIHQSLKVNYELFSEYVLPAKEFMNENSTLISDMKQIKSFNTKFIVIVDSSDGVNELKNVYDELTQSVLKKCDEFQESASGWALVKVLYLEVNINKYVPMQGSSYIPLPKFIESKKACVNIKNNDNACFFWAVVGALYPPTGNIYRVTSYPNYGEVLNVEGMNYPVKIDDIKLFEKNNPQISVNIYGIDESNKKIIGPLYLTKSVREKHVNLLYIENIDKQHYCCIKNMSRLVSGQLSKHKTSIHLCNGCLMTFASDEKLQHHKRIGCGEVSIELPPPNTFLSFKNWHKKMNVPFVIYADFESILTPIATSKPSPEFSFSNNTHIHVPSSFAYYINCDYDKALSAFRCYRGPESASVFVDYLMRDIEGIYSHLKNIVPLKPMTDEEKEHFKTVEICHICEEKLGEDRVIDHSHLTGEYRSAAHNVCNINYRLPNFIPVFFHNLSGYDAHLFIMQLAEENSRVTVIPNNKEKYITFSRIITMKDGNPINLKFVDSYKFIACSLDQLASNLEKNQFNILSTHYSGRKFDLLRRKGVFPYEYIDSAVRFEENRLPCREAFYSHMYDSNISEHDYTHACNVWEEFQIQSLGEYSDLYLKTDVLLLADVFENFRKVCSKMYGLDPCQYLTAPSLSWDAMLKTTKIRLELLSDYEMIEFIKSSIRGGVCQATHRYSRANNKYMKSDYAPDEESKYIIYLDANNLYGWAMSQYLPIDGFRWLSPGEIEGIDIDMLDKYSETGYFFEVDLEYPDRLHDYHNDYPFCAQNKVSPIGKHKKLIIDLGPKFFYIMHYLNLKQCMANGLILKKIHRVLAFRQAAWLKPYIDMNNECRRLAKNTFEKDLYKLFNNVLFGKSIQSIDKQVDVKLMTHWDDIRTKTKPKYGANRYISKPNFHSLSIFTENFVAVQMKKTNVLMNIPIYLGYSILEQSKVLMYDFHYEYMKPKYGDRVKLLYTDTDSLLYEIKTDDFYSDIKMDLSDRFDTSDYHFDNEYNFPLLNKKVIGFMKDEVNGQIIYEYVGLRAKMYALKLKEKEVKKVKGIKASVVKKLDINNYKRCLFEGKNIIDSMYTFKSCLHTIYTQERNKLVLSALDDKRHIYEDNLKTLAWGHYSLNGNVN